MDIIKTKRLKLRNLFDSDFNDLYSLYNDKNIYKYMAFDSASEEEINAIILKSKNKTPIDNGAFSYAISTIKSEKFVGEIYLEKRSHSFLLGYAIKATCQKRGYAFEILRAFLKYLTELYPHTNILAIVNKENIPSQNLLKKLGFINNLYQEDSKRYYLYSLYGLIY